MDKPQDEKDYVAAPAPNDVVVEKPPRARVSDVIDEDEAPAVEEPRKRDYLDGFLAASPAGTPARS